LLFRFGTLQFTLSASGVQLFDKLGSSPDLGPIHPRVSAALLA
jgi:hypothetical protein